MLTIGQQKVEPFLLIALVALAAVAVGVGVLIPAAMPYALALTGAGVVMFVWGVKGDVTIWAWIWVLSYGLLDWPEWKIEFTGFFNMTVPRFVFLGAVMVFAFYFMIHRRRIRLDRGLLWAMLALVLYVALSAQMTGWTAEHPDVRSAPYYRFLGSVLFPFVIFFLLYNAGITSKQIQRGLLILTAYGWYALYIGYLQYAAIQGGAGWARELIWPAFINDPTYGIHFDRARGAFMGASPQAVFLVLLFFVDLYLIRKLKGNYRLALILQAILIPPAIFFTAMRSAYVAFIICGFVWVFFANRGRMRLIKLLLLMMVVVIGVVLIWDRLVGVERAAGGIAQRGPVVARKILLAQTWEMVKEAPLMGVGFGHFVDAQQAMPRDPTGLTGLSVGTLVEHNLFLNMAAETGVIGLTLSILVFILLFRESRKLYKKLPPGAPGYICPEFVVLFWVILTNYLVDAMFRDPLWDVFSNGLLWCTAALVVCCNRRLEPGPLELPIVPSTVEF